MSLEKYIKGPSHSARAKDMYAQSMRELASPAPSVVTRTFRKFDEITGGARAREFTILCGATGVGKTCFLSNLSVAYLAQNIPHFVASVETGPTDFVKRTFSVLHNRDLNGGDAIPAETLRHIHKEYSELYLTDSLSLSLYENRFSVEQLMSDIAYEVQERGCKIAMIDNLNFFLEVTRAADQLVEMDRVIHELIIFCKNIDVHLIMVMHPRKTDGGRVESEFDIKGSSTAVQEAHNIFLLNKPHKKLIEGGTANEFGRQLTIAKMRRRGRFVGRSLLFTCTNGVSYDEDCMI